MENKRKIKPYGTLITEMKDYKLLAPQPLPRDSWMQDGTYSFSCAVWDIDKMAYFGCLVVTSGTFSVELCENQELIEVTVLTEDVDEFSLTEEEMQEAEEWVRASDDWDIEEDVNFIPTEDLPFEDEMEEDENE